MRIKQLIFEHWSALERKQGRRITLKELAEMIGIEYSYFNHIYNQRRPATEEQINLLYDFTLDARFFDAAGFDRPDFSLRYVMKKWGSLSDVQKNKIAKIVESSNGKDGGNDISKSQHD